MYFRVAVVPPTWQGADPEVDVEDMMDEADEEARKKIKDPDEGSDPQEGPRARHLHPGGTSIHAATSFGCWCHFFHTT